LQKAIKANLDKVHYLKNTEVIVKTKPENDFFKLFLQRVRWAGKTTSYSSAYAKILAVLVLLMNLSLVVGCWLLVVGKLQWQLLLGIFLVKYVVDCILLLQSNSYLRKVTFLLPIASSLVYPIFSSAIGIYALFFGFTWKGRKFKK